MANEINIQAALTFQRLSPAIVQGSGARDVTQTGKRGGSNIQNLADTSQNALIYANVPLASLGFLFIKNLNPDSDTKSVNISVATSVPTYAPFAKLYPGQFCLIPVNSVVTVQNIFAQGSAGTSSGAASIDLLIVAIEQ
jgi:hypothetical protein